MSTTASAETARIRSVIFDLDGTLIDSMPLVLKAFAHALEPFRPELSIDDIFARLGGPPLRTFIELTGSEENALEAMRRLEAFGFENGALVKPFEGMRVFLDTLRSKGLILAIWTGRDRATTESILTAHGLTGLFQVVVCGDDLPTHKPHPEGIATILKHLDVKAHEALYAGDADADVLGGAAVGVRTILIRHGRSVDTAVSAQAWRDVDLPGDAYKIIGEAVI